MDWLDFFSGMLIGAIICEDEYEKRRESDYDPDFEEYIYRQYLQDKKQLRKNI